MFPVVAGRAKDRLHGEKGEYILLYGPLPHDKWFE